MGRLYSIFFTNIHGVKEGPDDKDPKHIFTRGQMSFEVFMDNLLELFSLTIGYILVKATKIPIRQMSTQVIDSTTEVDKIHSDLEKY